MPRFRASQPFLFLTSLLVLTCGAADTGAASSTCSQAQRQTANAQLMAIAGDETRQAGIVERHLPFGIHVGAHAAQGGPDNEDLLLQEGYALLHDRDLRTGLWVSYKLTGDDVIAGEGKPRINCFRRDPRLARDHTAFLSDYDEPIYDQGHMANDADLKDDETEQVNSYMLSNMSPQHCRFNRGIWLSLEKLGRIWAKKYDTLYITSGAVFDANPRNARDKDNKTGRMGSRNQKARVAIPSDYYKIFLRKEGETWHSIAFLLEHHNGPHGVAWSEVRPDVEDAITALEAIEARTETSFHPDLTRAQLVQSEDGSNWDLETGDGNFESSC